MADQVSQAGAIRNRHVLVALTGGIACYKVASLISRLVQSGASVTALMTESARKFIGPTTLESLTGRPVLTSIWQPHEDRTSPHVAAARSADLMVIAPASANTIARLAAGICDSIVTEVACALPRDTPVLVAPSMNEQMWQNPITQRNVQTIQSMLDYQLVGPESGWQACRTSGDGRMTEPERIYERIDQMLRETNS